MPNDLTIKAVAAVTGASENSADPRAGTPMPPAPAPLEQGAGPMPNPQLRLDAALGLVVIEFRDNSGTVTTSIPSQRQLEAYRMWEQRHNAPPNTLPGALPGTPPGALPGTPPGALHGTAPGNRQPHAGGPTPQPPAGSPQPPGSAPRTQPAARVGAPPVYQPATRKT